MVEARRQEIMREVFARVQGVADAKAVDYASKTDTLANFKELALVTGVTPFEVWRVLFMKHVVSVIRAIKQNPCNPVTITEPIDGRIDDLLNYLVLFLCLVEDAQAPERAFLEAIGEFEDSMAEVNRIGAQVAEAAESGRDPGDETDQPGRAECVYIRGLDGALYGLVRERTPDGGEFTRCIRA